MPILLGYLCGFPSGAKTVDTMLANKQISQDEAYILASFVNNCSPIFILTTVGITMMGNITVGLLLLISHFASSFLFGIIYSRFHSYNIIHDKNNFSIRFGKNMSNRGEKEDIPLPNMTKFEILQKSMLNTFITLGFILGFMVIFNLLADITYPIFKRLISNTYTLDMISGLFEMTRGVNSISHHREYFNNILAISFLLGFSGFSVIFQIKSSFKHLNMSVNKLVLFKLIHGILSVIIAYILLKYTNILNIDITAFSNIETEESFRKTIAISYAHSLSLILLILSTYFLVRNEKTNITKK